MSRGGMCQDPMKSETAKARNGKAMISRLRTRCFLVMARLRRRDAPLGRDIGPRLAAENAAERRESRSRSHRTCGIRRCPRGSGRKPGNRSGWKSRPR